MIRVKFNLKEPSKEMSLIYLVAYMGTKCPLRYSTSEIVPSQYWNKDMQKMREVREYPKAKLINRKLDKMRRFLEDYHLEATETPSQEQMRNALDEFLGKKTRQGVSNIFTEYFEHYNTINAGKSNIKSYKTTLAHIQDLMPHSAKLHEIDYTYLETFAQLFKEQVIQRGKYKGRLPSLNYTALQIQNIRAVINDARKKGMRVNPTISDFKKKTEETDAIYLSQAELEKIDSLTLPPRLEKAKDIFIIGCYTAMRVSDYKRLKLDYVKGDLLQITMKKTGDKVIMPLHPIVKKALVKYDYTLPTISDQKLNEYIKEVAQAAELNDTIVIKRTEGEATIERVCKKWEMVTSHTARRTGATNMYLAGIPTLAIMMITGHRTEKAFLKYIRVTKEENAIRLASHPYFNAKPCPDQSESTPH